MAKDPIVDEVRRIRDEYAAQFNYDLNAIYRDLKEREQRGEFSVVYRRPRPVRMRPQRRRGAAGA
jgi:hypothetical protein